MCVCMYVCVYVCVYVCIAITLQLVWAFGTCTQAIFYVHMVALTLLNAGECTSRNSLNTMKHEISWKIGTLLKDWKCRFPTPNPLGIFLTEACSLPKVLRPSIFLSSFLHYQVPPLLQSTSSHWHTQTCHEFHFLQRAWPHVVHVNRIPSSTPTWPTSEIPSRTWMHAGLISMGLLVTMVTLYKDAGRSA